MVAFSLFLRILVSAVPVAVKSAFCACALILAATLALVATIVLSAAVVPSESTLVKSEPFKVRVGVTTPALAVIALKNVLAPVMVSVPAI